MRTTRPSGRRRATMADLPKPTARRPYRWWLDGQVLGPLVILVVASAVGVLGYRVWSGERQLVGHGVRVQGVVIEPADWSGGGAPGVAQFETEAGVTFTVEGGVGSIGSQVDIIYDPSDPARASLDRFLNLWDGTIVFGGLSFIGLLWSLGALITYPGGRRWPGIRH